MWSERCRIWRVRLHRWHFVTAQFVGMAVLISAVAAHISAQQRPYPNNAESDISGLWLNNTATPLIRPAEFADRSVFTEDEAREYETHYLADRVRGLGGDFAFELQVNGDFRSPDRYYRIDARH
jgi:hypothetical protein